MMTLTTLEIPAHYDPAFLKALAQIEGAAGWGVAPGDESENQRIIFEVDRTDDVVAAINGYEAAWLARAKAAAIEAVADLRKAAIRDRFSFNGMAMKLDPDTENALSKAYAALSRRAADTTIDWEVSRGVFVSLDLATIGAISDAAFAHVQAAFTNAKNLTVAINAAQDLDALDAIDLNAGWAQTD